MARTDNFTNFATDVADSIRDKTGETGLIPASEFDTRIKSIETKEDLNEELNTYNTEVTEQEVSIDTIIEALEGKAAGSGGVLSLQDKSIEITENGTTNIVADDGYYGLNSVDVTVNVEGGETTIIDAKVYSTEEQLVGKWIDNKPLYRKTYNVTLTNAVTAGVWGEATTTHSIANVETIFIGEGSFIKDSAGTVYEVNCATHISNTSVRILKTTVNSANIYTIWSADMLSAGDIVAQYTLYYTKTTDVATDETLGTVNYSTEEQVVGTNIDGLTLYQKTIVGDGLSYSPNGGNTTNTIAHNIDNVKDIYISNGSFVYSNYYSGTSRNIYQPNMFNAGATPGRQYITTRVDKTNITQIVGDWIIGGYNSICTRITLRYTKTV